MAADVWPPLPLQDWKDTYATLHMWTQIVGKIRLAQTPPFNHWWNVTLYVTSRGLTTSAMPYDDRIFEMEFDFLDHNLLIKSSDGGSKAVRLYPRSVADFYREALAALQSLRIPVTIWSRPVEVEDRTPFEQDQTHAAYDPEYAQRVWRILLQTRRHQPGNGISPVSTGDGATPTSCSWNSQRRRGMAWKTKEKIRLDDCPGFLLRPESSFRTLNVSGAMRFHCVAPERLPSAR